jgi:ABC-type iron transport system FetAB ATPase subunit
MEITETDIKRIHSKLQQVLQQYAVLKKENARLQHKVQHLSSQQEQDQQLIYQLQQQVQLLKSAAGQMTESDKKSFEKQLSKYIKEIDKCIAMLGE